MKSSESVLYARRDHPGRCARVASGGFFVVQGVYEGYIQMIRLLEVISMPCQRHRQANAKAKPKPKPSKPHRYY
ncbi:hypothetical protein EYC80_005740 [Monilinia laxa]|uniref:Uncharacterized protein n=1 Tax=Monilinia laxa TaxID=61186 RepID=A0A5N6KEY8_MONLA|nr:hypothetical protein EYC80_005740 [Monilinia laxa]